MNYSLLPFASLWIFIPFLILVTGCQSVFSLIIGVKQPKELSDIEILKYCERYNVPKGNCYVLDSTYLSAYISPNDSLEACAIGPSKNRYQPLQVVYYDSTGFAQSFHVNCDVVKWFPRLKWNGEGDFDEFIPRSNTKPDSLYSLEEHLSYANPIKNITLPAQDNNYDYTVIVHWNRWMGTNSKRLVKVVRENLALAGDQSVRVLFVNNDNYFAQIYGE